MFHDDNLRSLLVKLTSYDCDRLGTLWSASVQTKHFTVVKHCWQKQISGLHHIQHYVFIYSYNTESLFYPPCITSHSLHVFQCVCEVWPVTSYDFCDTVQHSQHSVYYSVSRQFNSHLFCFLCSILMYPFPIHMHCSFPSH